MRRSRTTSFAWPRQRGRPSEIAAPVAVRPRNAQIIAAVRDTSVAVRLLFSQSKFYYYFSLIYDYNPGDLVGRVEEAKADADLANFLDRAEFVILEANEAELGIGHIMKFAAAVEALQKPKN